MSLGKYSADKALKGIYKVFMRIATPHFLSVKPHLFFRLIMMQQKSKQLK